LPLFPLLNNTLSSQPSQAFYQKKGDLLKFYLRNNQLEAGEKLTGAISG
jgi:hypothetical protein